MPTFSLHERGYRDAWHGREPRECDEVYLAGYEAGARDTDRTRRAAGRPRQAGSLIAGHSAPAADQAGDACAVAGSLLVTEENRGGTDG